MQQSLTEKVAQLLTLENMPESQQLAVCERVGSIALEAALNRQLVSLTPEQVAELELYLDVHDDSANIFSFLIERYPMLETYFEEEVMALQLEIVSIMS